MEVSGQFHTQVALSVTQEPAVPAGQAIWMWWRREISQFSKELIPVVQPVVSRHLFKYKCAVTSQKLTYLTAEAAATEISIDRLREFQFSL
jgi:hypothetical protein